MNRNAEYEQLLSELDAMPVPRAAWSAPRGATAGIGI